MNIQRKVCHSSLGQWQWHTCLHVARFIWYMKHRAKMLFRIFICVLLRMMRNIITKGLLATIPPSPTLINFLPPSLRHPYQLPATIPLSPLSFTCHHPFVALIIYLPPSLCHPYHLSATISPSPLSFTCHHPSVTLIIYRHFNNWISIKLCISHVQTMFGHEFKQHFSLNNILLFKLKKSHVDTLF